MLLTRIGMEQLLVLRLIHLLSPATGLVDQLRHQAGPAGLVTGPQTGTIVAMKVFIEQNQILPMRILLKGFQTAVNRPIAIAVAQKQFNQPVGQFSSDLLEGQLLVGAGWKLNFEGVAVVMMKFLQGLD